MNIEIYEIKVNNNNNNNNNIKGESNVHLNVGRNKKSNWDSDTPYPHVYINFCNYGNKSRIQPVTYRMDLKDERELEVNLIFGPEGSTWDVTYIIYYFYTDNNLLLNLPKQTSNVFFSSPYILQRGWTSLMPYYMSCCYNENKLNHLKLCFFIL